MIDSNKITNTKIGDDIHFYVNGTEDRGIVVKMNNEYVTIFKESTQEYDDIHINDTFFIKDILINKEWDKMEDDERYDALKKIHAPSPSFIMKSWNDLPKEIKELLTKNNAIETSYKDGKDDDMNRVGTRDNQSNKGFGGTELEHEEDKEKPDKGTAGEKIENEKPKGGETESRDAGDKKQGQKQQHEHMGAEGADKFGHGKRSHSGQETPDHTRASDKIQLLSQQVSKDPEIAASDKIQEADLQDTSAVDRQIVESGKIQGRKDQGKKGKEIKEGVEALKAWQLWLAKREQEVLKESEPTEKSWQERIEELKTNSERSIHGNAAREPNSGVNTNIGFDASEDYEGFTHSGVRPEQFKHEKLKPKVTTKERINIGSTAPSQGGQGTGDGGNPHNTRQQNKDVKGRAVSGKDRK